MSTVFGPLVTPDDVAVAVEEHVRTWMRTYLDHPSIATKFSRRIPSIGSYRRTNTRPERWPEDKPSTLVIVAEDVTDVLRDGDGTITLTFPVGLALVASSTDQDASNKLAKAMGAALMLLLQQKSEIDITNTITAVTEWLPFKFGEMQPENSRRLAALSQGLLVHVPVMTEFGGPRTPTPDDSPDPIPPGDYVDVVRVEIDDQPLD